MRPQRRCTSGITSGRVTLKNPSSVVRVTSSQSSAFMVGKWAIARDAGVVDDDVDGPVRPRREGRQRGFRGARVVGTSKGSSSARPPFAFDAGLHRLARRPSRRGS